jgi:arabinofuranosyltransferase
MSSNVATHGARSESGWQASGVRVLILVFLLFFVSVVVRTAWVADDAYVDLRTAVNAASGLGLRWNVDERVQAFTDPAWVVLLSAVSLVWHDPYSTLLLLDFILSAGAAVWLSTQLAADSAAALLGLSVLSFSKAFIEYSTSGLQVPLVYFLIVAFWVTCWRMSDGRRRTAILFVIAAVCLLTDTMSVLLLVPALGQVLRQRAERRLVALLPGLAIVAGWALFATLYFGSPVPTPVVAGWNAAWPLGARVSQGGVYLLDAADRDPLTVITIACGIAMLFVRRFASVRSLASGLLLYCAAVVLSGGDWLSGRALAPALLAATILLIRLPWSSLGSAFPVIVVLVWGLGVVSPFSPVRSDAHYGRGRAEPLPDPWPRTAPTVSAQRAAIRDERWLTYSETGLLTARRGVPLPDTLAIEEEVGQILARGERVVVTDRIGLFAFVSGTRLHVVDPLGRTDPLLARLPPLTCCAPRGAARAIPDGYVETLETGRNVIGDGRLAEMYRRVVTLSRRPCFDRTRLTALIE